MSQKARKERGRKGEGWDKEKKEGLRKKEQRRDRERKGLDEEKIEVRKD